jgi:hypothetical protein
MLSRLIGWRTRSAADASRPVDARLGADVVRHAFIVVGLHHLLLAGRPAHLTPILPQFFRGALGRIVREAAAFWLAPARDVKAGGPG